MINKYAFSLVLLRFSSFHAVGTLMKPGYGKTFPVSKKDRSNGLKFKKALKLIDFRFIL